MTEESFKHKLTAILVQMLKTIAASCVRMKTRLSLTLPVNTRP